ncbi:VanW family protein [Nocardia sp. NPDC004654]|uniref:VanW family protein n=1 Tax=Nocardia sp. NPDC004654 TaxID=3154776 RepID=UPI0033BEFE4C
MKAEQAGNAVWAGAWEENNPAQASGGALGADAAPAGNATPVGNAAWSDNAGPAGGAAWSADAGQVDNPAWSADAGQADNAAWSANAEPAGNAAWPTNAAQRPHGEHAAHAGHAPHGEGAANAEHATAFIRRDDVERAAGGQGVATEHATAYIRRDDVQRAAGGQGAANEHATANIRRDDLERAAGGQGAANERATAVVGRADAEHAPYGGHTSDAELAAHGGRGVPNQHATAFIRRDDAERAAYGAHGTPNEHATAVIGRPEHAPYGGHGAPNEHATAFIRRDDVERPAGVANERATAVVGRADAEHAPYGGHTTDAELATHGGHGTPNEHATAFIRRDDAERAAYGMHGIPNDHATAVIGRPEHAPYGGHTTDTEHATAIVPPADTENRQRWENARRPRPRPEPADSKSWWRTPAIRRAGIVAGAVIAVGGLGYAVDAVLSSGDVPRGVVVAGIDIGGMDVDEADAKLRTTLDGRAGQELPLQIGDVQAELTPSAAGLAVDWQGTWDRIGGQPINPFARLVSFFGTREVSVASTVDDAALDRQLTALRVHDRPTVEGTIQFQNGKPVAVPPVPGRVLDTPAARNALIDNWIEGGTLELPVVPAPLTVRPEAVQSALHEIAEPAVRGDVVFTGKDGDATLTPEQIATVLSFAPDGHGGLAANYDLNAATAILAPQLAKSEVEAKDATFAVTGGAPRVVPAVVGDKINWPKTLEQLPTLLAASQQRSAPAVYEKIEPKLTTEAAQGLGIVEQMGAFTTSGFSGPSGVNIRTVANKVNGAVVRPGETFSLNEFTGPRGTAEGYVESGIIDHGRPSTAVGGGISQFATTLYNAAYFAGLEDAGHTEHSYYISRYPAAREATVFDGAIDLKFRNNTQSGVYIETFATGTDITVRLWGTKTVDVESITGDKTKPTEPTTITLPKGKDCIASEGAPGFTITDTRVITDRKTGREVSRATRTVKYDPIPVVKCE